MHLISASYCRPSLMLSPTKHLSLAPFPAKLTSSVSRQIRFSFQQWSSYGVKSLSLRATDLLGSPVRRQFVVLILNLRHSLQFLLFHPVTKRQGPFRVAQILFLITGSRQAVMTIRNVSLRRQKLLKSYITKSSCSYNWPTLLNCCRSSCFSWEHFLPQSGKQ